MSLPALDPSALIEGLGYVGLFAIVFAESGLFFGFFLPGDSLLFTAGLLASADILNIWTLLIVIPIAAILGDQVGYWFGSWIGPRVFKKEDSFFFSKAHIARAENFYQKYGPKAIVLARFVPIVRTFIPILAGVGRMNYRTFVTYNIIGALLWGVGVTLLGYFLGQVFPHAEEYLLPIVVGIILISLIPIVREWLKARKHKD